MPKFFAPAFFGSQGVAPPPTPYNVMSYGAHADGSTDDVGHIQDAIDACAAAGGGVVYMPAGTYKVTQGHDIEPGSSGGNIELKTGVTLRGAGQEVTIIKAGTNNASAIGAFQKRNVAVEDLTVYDVAGTADAIKILSCSGVSILRVTARDSAYSGIAALGCNIVTVTDCLAYNLTNFGIAVGTNITNAKTPDDTYAVDATVTGCEAYSCDNTGFRTYGNATADCDDVTYDDCYSHSNGVSGSGTADGFFASRVTNLTMTNCRAWDNGGFNSRVEGVHTATITNTGYKMSGSFGYLVTRILHVSDNTSPEYTNAGAYAVYGESTSITETGAHEDT